MFHTVAYSVALTATANTDMTAVPDGIMLIQNGHIVPQADMQILYGYLTAVTLVRGKISSASIRQYSPAYIRPIDTAVSPTSRTPVADYRANPLTAKGLEELQVLATDSAAGPNTATAVLGLQIGGMQAPALGQVITMRGTGTTTLGASAWTLAAIAWEDTLPAGTYQCIGLSGFSATGIAARLIFEGQNWRPGVIIGATAAIIPHPMFLKGGLGVLGLFTANRMPNVEFLATAADTAEEVYLDLVRVA